MVNHEVRQQRQQLSPEQEVAIASFHQQIEALEQQHTPVAEQIAAYPQSLVVIERDRAAASIGHAAKVVSLLRGAAEQVPTLVTH